MINIILIAIGAIGIVFLLLFVYCACVISGRCSREEEKRELIRNVQETSKRR